MVDERLSVVVEGVGPRQLFTLRAVTFDQRDRAWEAEAEFTAGPDGAADLTQVAPSPGGSYEGVDEMGLFWSASPTVEGAQIAHRPSLDYVTRLELIVDGVVVDSAVIRRRFDASDLLREEIEEAGLVGAYYRPQGPGPFPGVVVFAGSDGGLESAEWRASLLASRGVAALAVAVFNHEGRPDDLVELPLEYGVEAFEWLLDQPETGEVGVLGFSKGSELALNLAARETRVASVVAISPTAYVWPGVTDGPPETRSSWTWKGEPLPAIPWSIGPVAGSMFGRGPPFRLRVLYEESLEAAPPAIRNNAEIPVSEIVAPVLLVSGEDDGSWPATSMAEAVKETILESDPAADVTHLQYPGAGHLLFWDYLPVTTAERNAGQIFGGTAAGTAAARADSWPRLQSFLRRTLVE
ncbi:MAG: acyl-CoA thioesterase/BAAT N-terminal domain-containing protein [Gemmatimonadetes bacterium]|nr:acyl-CoA thioesterase/BAAT N-terminal domain-containing protein [Gemmatimonadota bacterium]